MSISFARCTTLAAGLLAVVGVAQAQYIGPGTAKPPKSLTELLQAPLDGQGVQLRGRLLQFDALAMRFRETRLSPDPACPVCAPDRAFPGYVDYEAFCAGGGH